MTPPKGPRQRTITANIAALGITEDLFDILTPLGVGFVKIAAPLYERQDSGQWSAYDCTCAPTSQTRQPANGSKNGECTAIGKHPMGKGWQENATRVFSTVETWLKEGNSAGLYPLPGCRVIGLDEDREKALDDLFTSVGEVVPWDRTVGDTVRGKRHLFLTLPEGFDAALIVDGRFDGGDILADGHVRQFVAPNMLHTAGRRVWNGQMDLAEASLPLLTAIIESAKTLKGAQAAAKVPTDPGYLVKEPGRHAFLLSSAAHLRNAGLDEAGIYAALDDINQKRCDPPKDDGEVRKIARDFAVKDSVADYPVVTITLPATNGTATDAVATEARLKRLSSFYARKVDWLWEGWMPKAEPVMVEGLGGEGKSTFVVDLMSRLTTGADLPDGSKNPFGAPTNCIYITGEDDPDRVLKPRFMAARADLDRIHFWATKFTAPDDLQHLTEDIVSTGDVALVFIDPLFSHINAKLNPNSDTDMRAVLDPIRQVAHLTGTTILIARHLNKKSGDEISLRGSGSYGGLTGAVRALLHAMGDPDDETKTNKVIGVIKTNYAKTPRPWKFAIEDAVVDGDDGSDIHTARLRWLGQSDKWMDEIADKASSLRGSKSNSTRYADDRKEADTNLRDILTGGPLPATEVVGEMSRRGHSDPAIRSARLRLNVISERPGKTSGPYIWRLPETDAHSGRKGHGFFPDED